MAVDDAPRPFRPRSAACYHPRRPAQHAQRNVASVLFARRRSPPAVSVSHLLPGWFAVYLLGLPGER